jgi:transcriptional regulator with XRE-family HTH domain
MATKIAKPNRDVSMRIKELRAELGWPQRVMAEVMGVELTRYQKWEQRGRIPAEFLPKFSQLTNRTIEFILTGGRRDHPQAPGVDEAQR